MATYTRSTYASGFDASASRGAVDATAVHASAYVAIATLAAAFAPWLTQLPMLTQAYGLLALVCVLGMPHGATDVVPARAVLQPAVGWLWMPVFLISYVAVALAFASTWWLWPTFALAAFLIIAILHFAYEDAAVLREPNRVLLFDGLSRGAIPIAAPTVFHTESVLDIFAVLSGLSFGVASEQIVFGLAAVVLVLALATAAYALISNGSRHDLASQSFVLRLEPFATALLFAALPPLIAFVVYFCVLHSVRHILAQAERLQPGRPLRGVAMLMLLSAPFSIAVAVAMGLVLWRFQSNLEPDDLVLRVVFIGLAALTVPHVMYNVAADWTTRRLPGAVALP